MATKIILGQLSAAVADLIESQGLDRKRLCNAVNSALGELSQDGTPKVAGKASVSKGTEKKAPSFKLTERVATKFSGGVSYPLRFFFLNQETLALEQVVGEIKLAKWPSYVDGWMQKFVVVDSNGPAEDIAGQLITAASNPATTQADLQAIIAP